MKSQALPKTNLLLSRSNGNLKVKRSSNAENDDEVVSCHYVTYFSNRICLLLSPLEMLVVIIERQIINNKMRHRLLDKINWLGEVSWDLDNFDIAFQRASEFFYKF